MHTKYINNISRTDMGKIILDLERRGLKSAVDGLYWLPIPEHLLTSEQKAHAESCGPHALALETLKNGLCLEFLVRARGKITCSCVGLADETCEAFMLEYLDNMLKELGVEQ